MNLHFAGEYEIKLQRGLYKQPPSWVYAGSYILYIKDILDKAPTVQKHLA